MADNRRVTPELAAILADLPDKPGVYLMRDARRSVLYVGKAQSLRSRVRSYWQKRGASEVPLRIESALDRVVDVEVTLTDNVSEALLLEANLIKRFQPRFNVRLKDDKSYPFIKVTLGDDFPRISAPGKLPRDGSRYFGPYASASSVDEAMNLIRRLFPFQDLHDRHPRGRTGAPTTVSAVSHQALPGPLHRGHLRARRTGATSIGSSSSSRVARRRSRVPCAQTWRQPRPGRTTSGRRPTRQGARAIERTMESQKMAADATTEQDVLGFARSGAEAAVQLFAVRDGKLVARDVFVLENVAGIPDDEALAAFVSSTTPRRDRCRCASWRRPCPPMPPTFSSCSRRGVAGASPSTCPDAAGSVSSWSWPRGTRPSAGARAGPLAGRRGQDARRARGAGRCPRARCDADPHRVLRHQHHPGDEHGRQHGRLRGRAAAHR
jgi:excinuclease ABC subunit C